MAPHLSLQLLIAAGGFISYVLAKKWHARYTNLKHLPRAPGGHWFWGHEKEAWNTPDRQFFQRNFEDLGTGIFVMSGALGHPDILAINDPAAISQIFTKNSYDYTKSAFTRPFTERLIGRGIVWAEGDEHKRQRPMLSPVFSHARLRRSNADVHASVEKFLVALTEHVDHSTADHDGAIQINAVKWADKVTIDVIGKIGLGYDFQLGEAPEAKLILDAFFDAVAQGHKLPGLIVPLVIRAFPFVSHLPIKSLQAEGKPKLITRDLATRLIRERKLLGEDGHVKGKDYLSALLSLYDDSDDEKVWHDISDQILVMILTNQDEVSQTIASALHALARDKASQDRLRRELLSFGSSSGGVEPTYDDYLNQMPFLDACVKETLRLWPALETGEREATKEDILPLSIPVRDPKSGKEINSVRIRAGQLIIVSHRAVNHSKDVWVDADEFKPQRWFEALPPSSKTTKGWNGLFTFLEGPRACIGIRLALLETKAVLSGLIKNFEFLPVEGPDGEIESFASGTNRITVVGKRDEGGNVPVRIRPLHAM